jgi:hypothetical protein
MKAQFVLAIECLESLGRLANGIEIIPGLRVINEPRRITCLRNPVFQEAVGGLELNSLQNAKLLVYTEFQEFTVSNPQKQISHLLDVVNGYLSTLWLLVEHTAYFDRGYLMQVEGGVHSNTQVTSFYDYKGERTVLIRLTNTTTICRVARHGRQPAFQGFAGEAS